MGIKIEKENLKFSGKSVRNDRASNTNYTLRNILQISIEYQCEEKIQDKRLSLIPNVISFIKFQMEILNSKTRVGILS